MTLPKTIEDMISDGNCLNQHHAARFEEIATLKSQG